jgi:hypothetical protein
MSDWPAELGRRLDAARDGLLAYGATRMRALAAAEVLADNRCMPDLNKLDAEKLQSLARFAAMNALLSVTNIEVFFRPLAALHLPSRRAGLGRQRSVEPRRSSRSTWP